MKLTVLEKDELAAGRWYVGRGRTSNVALWDGEIFLTIGNDFGAAIKREPYYEPDGGCFQPFLLLDEDIKFESPVLPKARLVHWRWYLGRGISRGPARWNKEHFLTIAEESGQMVVERAQYSEALPVLLVSEGRMIKPFGKHGWDAHYGSALEI